MSKEIISDIDLHLSLIESSLEWAKKFGKDAFPIEKFKGYRRSLRTIRTALESNCAAAAYGESQVGKSYLMNSLLSSSDEPFVISNGDREYSFIDDLNPSGGNTTRVESTGVITRFTIASDERTESNYVRVRLLSVVDIILLIADSYYNDIRHNADTSLTIEGINSALEGFSSLWQAKQVQQTTLCEDDIYDIADYINEVIGGNAVALIQSKFFKTIAPVIKYVSYDKWCDVFSLLWNKNKEMSRLFTILISEYKKLAFTTEVYVPFDAMLREKGTLLKIEWLDTVCDINTDTGKDEVYTNVCYKNGSCIATDFHKGYLSALIAEMTFYLPTTILRDRPFLKYMDLLDFPGARSREKYKEDEIHSVLPKILRRGKVAYLFSKYSRSRQISSVLFCHHNDQKSEATIGDTISNWISTNIGASPDERASMLQDTSGIAPLFFIATKFNSDLKHLKTDTPNNLSEHWKRFDTVIPEIIGPARWFDEWLPADSNIGPMVFQNIYPLRDFFWSKDNILFVGYSDKGEKSPEIGEYQHPDFPNYLSTLKMSFLANAFVQKHFANPEQTWNDVATINNDGSKAIIRNLNAIAGVLDNARKKKYLTDLRQIQKEMYEALEVYYEPESSEAKNDKVKAISSDIRTSLVLTIGKKPEIFGQIIDMLMVSVEDLRNIAYDIVICHTEIPQDFTPINFVRGQAGISLQDSREENIQKLCKHFMCDITHLNNCCKEQGFTIDDILSIQPETPTTEADIVTNNIVSYWITYLNNQSKKLQSLMPHADEVVFMLINLMKKLGVRRVLTERINSYCTLFERNERPNAIADFASLTLNNFVSSVGRNYMSDTDISEIVANANSCGVEIDVDSRVIASTQRPLIDTLNALDKATTEINKENPNISILRCLPFWDNFQRWENLVLQGLVYTSDVSNVDPIANAQIKEIKNSCKDLYQ